MQAISILWVTLLLHACSVMSYPLSQWVDAQNKPSAYALKHYGSENGYLLFENGQSKNNYNLRILSTKTNCEVIFYFDKEDRLSKYNFVSSPDLCVHNRKYFILQ